MSYITGGTTSKELVSNIGEDTQDLTCTMQDLAKFRAFEVKDMFIQEYQSFKHKSQGVSPNTKQPTKGESKMKQGIIEAYPKTEDAILVEKYLGGRVWDILEPYLIKQFKGELLTAAKLAEAEEEARKKKNG